MQLQSWIALAGPLPTITAGNTIIAVSVKRSNRILASDGVLADVRA